jgi:hypothetical protein
VNPTRSAKRTVVMRRSSVWVAVIAYPQEEQNLAFAGI